MLRFHPCTVGLACIDVACALCGFDVTPLRESLAARGIIIEVRVARVFRVFAFFSPVSSLSPPALVPTASLLPTHPSAPLFPAPRRRVPRRRR